MRRGPCLQTRPHHTRQEAAATRLMRSTGKVALPMATVAVLAGKRTPAQGTVRQYSRRRSSCLGLC